MIRLNVFVQVESAKRADALKAAVALTEASLKDAGCVAYDIFESSTRENVLMICETWKDEASLDAHQAAEHFKKYVGKIQAAGTMKIEKFEF